MMSAEQNCFVYEVKSEPTNYEDQTSISSEFSVSTTSSRRNCDKEVKKHRVASTSSGLNSSKGQRKRGKTAKVASASERILPAISVVEEVRRPRTRTRVKLASSFQKSRGEETDHSEASDKNDHIVKKRSHMTGPKTCQLCGKTVPDIRAHIYRFHLKIPDMFSCTLCDYIHSYQRRCAYIHGMTAHGDRNVITSKANQYESSFKDLREKCFPTTKKLQLTLPFVQRENEVLAVSDACQLCKMDIRKRHGHLGSRRIHIYKYHLKVKDLFSCRACSYTNSSQRYHTLRHAQLRHDGDASFIVSKEAEYETEFLELMKRCFVVDCVDDEDYCEQHFVDEDFIPDSAPSSISALSDKFEGDHSSLLKEPNDLLLMPSLAIEEDKSTCVSLIESRKRKQRENQLVPHDRKDRSTVPSMLNASVKEEETPTEEQNQLTLDIDCNNDPESVEKLASSCQKFCYLCNVAVRNKREHIYRHHLMVEDMFACTKCDYKNSYERRNANLHGKAKHGSQNVIVSKAEQYETAVQKLLDQCFMNQKYRRLQLTLPYTKRQNSSLALSEECQLCKKPFDTNRREHVYRYHLKVVDLFQCKKCSFVSSYSKYRTINHAKKKHGGDKSCILSKEAEFQEDFLKLMEECFVVNRATRL
uniref:C2H2-type domain-containing protein n=1 Tax=Plectus sambesii TaxID=2011161 RepID=A0A914V018_9BILA